jgi:microcystin-dependent protein
MPDIVKGHTFVSGEVVEPRSLNDLVDNAVIQPTLISEKVLKDPAALSDRILIEDSGALKGITIQQIIDLVTPSIVNSAVPIGTVCDFAGANAPTGWFLCQGQAVDRDELSDLFAQIGTTYGAGDGTTTFNLPDCRGRFVAAMDAGSGRIGDPALNVGLNGNVMGSTGGLYYNVMSVNQMPAHGHTASTTSLAPMHTNATEGASNRGLPVDNAFAGRIYITAGYETGVQSTTSIGASGGNGAQNNVPPTIMMQKIIKALNA